jgi:hypothetical protein
MLASERAPLCGFLFPSERSKHQDIAGCRTTAMRASRDFGVITDGVPAIREYREIRRRMYVDFTRQGQMVQQCKGLRVH